MTEELVTAKEIAESGNDAKSVFMANMSHELHSPLNAIIGFAEMLKKEALGPLATARYLDYGHDVHVSGKHLLSIINTILDLAKTEGVASRTRSRSNRYRSAARGMLQRHAATRTQG